MWGCLKHRGPFFWDLDGDQLPWCFCRRSPTFRHTLYQRHGLGFTLRLLNCFNWLSRGSVVDCEMALQAPPPTAATTAATTAKETVDCGRNYKCGYNLQPRQNVQLQQRVGKLCGPSADDSNTNPPPNTHPYHRYRCSLKQQQPLPPELAAPAIAQTPALAAANLLPANYPPSPDRNRL